MRRTLLLPLLALTLAACSQGLHSAGSPSASSPAANSSLTASYASRPELQDAQSRAILSQYANDPGLLEALQEAYGEIPAQGFTSPAISTQSDSPELQYVKTVAWGSVAAYNTQYANRASAPYPLDWSRDGCSAPEGLGLGYRQDFEPACNVHDFGYRNLKVLQRTDANRKTTDENLYANTKAICAAKSWYKRPPCYAAAYAYYEAVRLGGSSSF